MTYSNGTTPDVTYAYDALGRRVQMTDGSGSTAYSYDSLGRLTSTTDGSGATVAYAYDLDGNPTAITYPGGQVVHRTYDAAGQLISVTDWLGHTTTYTYDADGNPTTQANGNDTTATNTYDAADQLTGITDDNTGGPTATFAYARNADGLVTADTETGQGALSQTYAYNSLNELTGADGHSLTYDPSGNLTTTESGATQTYNNADELTTQNSGAGTTTYGYNAEGERISTAAPGQPVTGYSYNQAGEITNIASYPVPVVEQVSPSYGPPAGGSQVTITGSGFTGTTGVDFGDTAASFTVESDTMITATAPPGAGSVDITITTPGGTSSISTADQFQYQGAGAFGSLSPARILDTRHGTGATGPVGANKSVTVQVTGHGGVPASGVGAVVLNVTATAPTAPGYLTVYPDGTTRPTTSNLNFSAGETVPNLVVVPVGADGKIDVFNGSGGTVQVIGDVSGYYLSGTPAIAGAFGSLSPARILDTRHGTGATGPVGANKSVTVQVTGHGGVPASGVGAVVLNVTATPPTAPGYLTVYPDGTTRPTTSNLNFSAGETVPNLVVVPVGADGKIDVFNGSGGTVQVIGDVSGYYLSGTPAIAGAFGSLSPARILDTRHGTGATGPVGANKSVTVQVTGHGGVPASGVGAVVLNVTATAPTAPGYLTVYPDGTTRPTTSNLNFSAGETVPNLVVVPVGADGKIDVFNGSGGTVQVIGDVSGYYLSGTPGLDPSAISGSLQAFGTRQLTQSAHSSANVTQVASYAYNGDGLRTSKTVGGVTDSFVWDTAGSVPLLLQESTPSATTSYVYGLGGTPIEQITGSAALWLATDDLGSVRQLTDDTGAVVSTVTYDAYGNVVTNTGAATSPFGYAGQYRDAESGLYYLRARYYDAGTGEFISVDPLASLTDQPYGYGMNDPVNQVDPLGLDGQPVQNTNWVERKWDNGTEWVQQEWKEAKDWTHQQWEDLFGVLERHGLLPSHLYDSVVRECTPQHKEAAAKALFRQILDWEADHIGMGPYLQVWEIGKPSVDRESQRIQNGTFGSEGNNALNKNSENNPPPPPALPTQP